MNYPESIYRKYEIVEKVICGEKHYGLVRVYTFFGIRFRKHIPVCSIDNYRGYSNGTCPQRWWSVKNVLASYIERDNQQQEYEFKMKVLK